VDDLKRLSKRKLIQMILERDERIDALEARLANIERMLSWSKKDSSTSSKPPSSDIVKPPMPAPKKGVKRKAGGQPGHDRHERKRLPPEQLFAQYEYSARCCSTCAGALSKSPRAPKILQNVELVGRAFQVTEHAAMWSWCPRCRAHERADLPDGVAKSGLFGPRMKAFVAYMKGACHMSYTTIQAMLADVLSIPASTGYLAKVVDSVSVALDLPYAQLREALAGEPLLNVDETGHKDSGKRYWTWCFRAQRYTVFKIDPSRGSCVLEEVLGDTFGGVLGSDLYSAYVKYAKAHDIVTQICLAHLIRDLRYLTTLTDRVTKNYGKRVLDAVKELFKIIHRRDQMQAAAFLRALEKAKAVVIRKAKGAPMRLEARTMAERFRVHGESYFTFMTSPGVEPTNNSAERSIRHVVIDRRITQGTRGTRGQRWSERIWSTLASCAQQKRSAFDLISQAVHAQHNGLAPPSLLPA